MPGPPTASAPLPVPPDGRWDAAVPIRLVRHSRFSLRLRWRLNALQALFDEGTFWARQRTLPELRRMLAGSQAVVSAWKGAELVGFGRATSDGVYRAVLWDVVVAVRHQGQGLGRRLVEALLQTPLVARAERVYAMTTNGAAFYARLGFQEGNGQHLMVRSGPNSGQDASRGMQGSSVDRALRSEP